MYNYFQEYLFSINFDQVRYTHIVFANLLIFIIIYLCLFFFSGEILVAIQGDRSKKRTAIVTLHDIGQNHITGFQSFFCFHQFRPLSQNFNVYHLNFPGQQQGAAELPQVRNEIIFKS